MKSESPFIQTIISNPFDASARMIYGDYLAEFDSQRADYLRLTFRRQPIQFLNWLVRDKEHPFNEEAESQIQYYADTFPKLKPILEKWKTEIADQQNLSLTREGLESSWAAMIDTFGRLRTPFRFFNNTNPGIEEFLNSPFREQLSSQGAILTFESDFRSEKCLSDELVRDVELLCGLPIGDCCYGSASCPVHPFMCELHSSPELPLTAAEVQSALRPKKFNSEHQVEFDHASLSYPGYHPRTLNDEIHTTFHEQYIFAQSLQDRGDVDLEANEHLFGNLTEDDEAQGDLKRHVAHNRLWYVVLHDWDSDNERSKGPWVVLLAVGKSLDGKRLLGVISHQMCHNLCD